jgi:hypothetical protein
MQPMTTQTPEALYAQIGAALLAAAPADWQELHVTYAEASTVPEARAWAVRTDGSQLGLRGVGGAVMNTFEQLRQLCYRPGRGTWFSARAAITGPGREVRVDLDYDSEPQWRSPVVPKTYAEDLELFPRDAAHQPAWLQQRLGEASE